MKAFLKFVYQFSESLHKYYFFSYDIRIYHINI
jgi:hypothetical protein